MNRAGRPRMLSPAQELEIIDRYNAGEDIMALVTEYGCDRKTLSNVRRRHGIPRRRMWFYTGPRSWHYGKGGEAFVAGQGYVRRRLYPDHPYFEMAGATGYALEHRLVMAEAIGRPLGRHETVHHINGERGDNRLENLQLRQGQHGAGQAFECAECGSRDVRPVEIAHA